MDKQSVPGVVSLWNMGNLSFQYLNSESQNAGDKAREVPGHEDPRINHGKEPILSSI